MENVVTPGKIERALKAKGFKGVKVIHQPKSPLDVDPHSILLEFRNGSQAVELPAIVLERLETAESEDAFERTFDTPDA